MSTPAICPNCGAEVPPKARACPACGSDELTGWSASAQYAHLLPPTNDSPTSVGTMPSWRRYIVPMLSIVLILALLLVTVRLPNIYLRLLLLIGIGAIGYFVFIRKGSRNPESQLYAQLLRRAGGDRQLVERLVAYEQRRRPSASRNECLRQAIARWDMDRR